ncbi:MAG: hypothetical protein U5N53_02980 [Mycobacterium sp.]|nr:hypothetical protein [Mycobacterium sp.]
MLPSCSAGAGGIVHGFHRRRVDAAPRRTRRTVRRTLKLLITLAVSATAIAAAVALGAFLFL